MQKFFVVFYLLLAFCDVLYAQQQSTGPIVSVRESMSKFSKADKRKEAVVELRKAGYPAFKGLRSLAKDAKRGRDERIAAVLLAGEIVKASTAAPIADREGFRKDTEAMLAGDKDDFVREASAITLGKLADKNAIKSLKSALNDKSGNVRMRAAWALAKNGDYSGKDMTVRGLKSSNVTEQVLAVEALDEMGDKTVIEEIRGNLKSDNVWTRINSALAIKRIEYKSLKTEEKISYLEQTMNDPQLEARNWAVKELAKKIEDSAPDRDKALAALKKAAKDGKNPASLKAAKNLGLLLKSGSIQEKELSN